MAGLERLHRQKGGRQRAVSVDLISFPVDNNVICHYVKNKHWSAVLADGGIFKNIPGYEKKTKHIYDLTHLIGVIDCDFQPSENLPLRWMLVHGQLKHVLCAVLSIEGRWVIVQVHHTDHQGGYPEVHQSAFRTHFWSLETWSQR